MPWMIKTVGHEQIFRHPRKLWAGIHPEKFKDGCPITNVGHDQRGSWFRTDARPERVYHESPSAEITGFLLDKNLTEGAPKQTDFKSIIVKLLCAETNLFTYVDQVLGIKIILGYEGIFK